ncbi:FadR/GntR family transcriptional regulator [Paenibacillus sp.]|uniref:FadR/GntR family transcriptional regulator n=1 Tax=Paenibacillus sp. TaxID=58172 RepID=UPI002D652093|nr:FadR/GntR family transcriptional regulator [Paenibacillus sp.]HZG86453.1 FadR/GntR family transcriptional regulator [Paenibacillus sp.]
MTNRQEGPSALPAGEAPRPMKSSEWVQADLLRQLDDGTFAPGARLPSVDELSRRYGVGRSTVREAISALKAMGRLAVRQGGGTFALAAPPPAPARDRPALWSGRAATLKRILEVRRVLEAGCAALAAANRTAEDVAALEALVAEMERGLGDQSLGEQADVKFHLGVAAATRNPLLVDMMESLTERLHDSMRDTRELWFYAEQSTAERLLREHRSILEAIRDGDAAEAQRRMEAHIAKVEQVLNELA